ncbi:MAG: hypothetical protein H9901_01545 [Candidatus Paralactobacillus gallistercoris]|uniref:Tetratricopeptide repeat protein n=1 Tax=Candidatus Paralactobacillus gallistercoris TaxID=2838724 RepID=A0A948TIP7_9LACO|nr:hypothetical protein [Candidatus Paralactobacillus gallistercoris]
MTNNIQTLMHQAAQVEQSGNWQQAVTFYQQAYEQSTSLLINQHLVRALLQLHDYEQAARLIDEYHDDYLQHADLTTLYLTTLTHQHKYTLCWCVYYQLPHPLPTQYQLIKTSEATYQTNHAAAVQQLQKQLMHITALPSLLSQLQLLQQADYLPRAAFITMAQFVLRDPFLSALLRGYLLDKLRQLRCQAPVVYLFFGEEKQVIPYQLPPMNASVKQQQIQQLLTEKLSIDQPQLLNTFTAQLQLDAATLYPCADQLIADPQLWAYGYYQWLHGEKITDKRLKWLEKCLQINNDLLY